MFIGSAPEKVTNAYATPDRSQYWLLNSPKRHSLLRAFANRALSGSVLGIAILVAPAAGQSGEQASTSCGARFADIVAQQQAIATTVADRCNAARQQSTVIRHYDDVASFDPSGGPAIFGSVAVPVHRTPFDARLRKLRATGLSRPGPWSAAIAQARPMDRIGQLRHINRWVNDHLSYANDATLNGTPDLWSPAAVTLARGRGDCEDYAIVKMALLAGLEFDPRDLFLVLVRDGARRSDHAILAVREGGRLHILDSTTNEVRESSNVPDYFPVMSFAAGQAWLHGYKVDRPTEPLRIATTISHTDWSDRIK